jgi:prepilin-type N-terminal cleavage/methylation domain-containing protein
MKKISKNKKGFSFIELMVVIAIISIMTTVTLVSMNTAQKKEALITAAREVAAVVRETQNYALTGKDLRNQINSCSFTFTWGDSSSSYDISGCKEQNYSLKNGVTFFNNGNFSFSVPSGNLNTSSTMDIILRNNNNNYHVCVYVSGIVNERPDGC